MKTNNIDCIFEQIVKRRAEKNAEKKNSGSYNFPVELEVSMVTLAKALEPSAVLNGHRNGFVDEKGREVHLQCAILRKNPTKQLVRDMLVPTLAKASLLVGHVGQAPNMTNRVYFTNGKIRLDNWSTNDYLVVKLDSQPEKSSPRTCAFNIADIRDGLSLEVKDYYAMRVIVRKHAVLHNMKVSYFWISQFRIMFLNPSYYVEQRLRQQQHRPHSMIWPKNLTKKTESPWVITARAAVFLW